ncbi:putative glutathione S-transferase GSTU6 [Panicum miliaceum]|uniref:Glutathione S-transferase n=1 Tax=Panicum miliaceum TaxID=4540 RepID=A0A3L6Q2D2_PANMI|nr:putative glutathione S-transferase GSTU6 [Panicum miliaceum]
MAAGGNKEDLKLLGSPVSPFAIRARMALVVKGVSYEYIEQDLFNKSELLRRSNPVHRKVPVLIHNGRPICESLIIVQYVDEALAGTAAKAILPADPYDRAIARFCAAYIDNKGDHGEERLQKVNQSAAKMKLLEQDGFTKCSNGKAFFRGDSIGYLDLALGSFLFWFKTLRQIFGVEIIDPGNTPILAAWAGHFMETMVAKKVAPEGDRMVEHFKKVYGAVASAL